jgi:uncharacterized OB-fold protein
MTSPLSIFTDHMRRGELAYQFSPAAGRAVFFPRLVCPYSGSTELEWRISKGLGTVYSFTTVRAENGDYNVALIDLDEGFRMMSTIVGATDAVRIGTRVAVAFEMLAGGEEPVAVFRPVDAETRQ